LRAALAKLRKRAETFARNATPCWPDVAGGKQFRVGLGAAKRGLNANPPGCGSGRFLCVGAQKIWSAAKLLAVADQKVKVAMARPVLGPEEQEAVVQVLQSGWIMQGEQVSAFERELAQTLGAANVIAVASGTSALELALRALELRPGDEVITPSHSFIATTNAIAATGATPIWADVESHSLSISERTVAHLLSPRTKAVVAAHQLGFAADLEGLLQLTQQAGIALVEDAACALGSTVIRPAGSSGKTQGFPGAGPASWPLGRPVGRFACFSFHPRKIITTGEGGAVVCNSARDARTVRALRQHGLLETSGWERADDEPDGYTLSGTNARMTDINAAIGRCQLRRLQGFVKARRDVAEVYLSTLKDHPVLCAPQVEEALAPNWQSFPTFLQPTTRFSARGVLRFLADRGVAARPGLTNAHEEPAYRQRAVGLQLPVSEALRRNTVMLPVFAGMKPQEIDAVVNALEDLRAAQT